LIVAHVVLPNVFMYALCMHVHQLSQWRSCIVSGLQTLCLFNNNWATCLKRLRTPVLVTNGYKSDSAQVNKVESTNLACGFQSMDASGPI